MKDNKGMLKTQFNDKLTSPCQKTKQKPTPYKNEQKNKPIKTFVVENYQKNL